MTLAEILAAEEPLPQGRIASQRPNQRLAADADRKLMSMGAGFVDPLSIPSAVTGLVSPETRDAWRGVQAEHPGMAMAGGIASSLPLAIAGGLVPTTLGKMLSAGGLATASDFIDEASGKEGSVGKGTAVKAVLSQLGVAPAGMVIKGAGGTTAAAATGLGAGALFPERVSADDGSEKSKSVMDQVVSSFRGKDFTPPSREEFMTRYAKAVPRPQGPPTQQEYVSQVENEARNASLSANPKAVTSADRAAERARARALSDYPSAVKQAEAAQTSWDTRFETEYDKLGQDTKKRESEYYEQSFSARNPIVSGLGGYIIPAAVAAGTFGKMRAQRSGRFDSLSDEIAGGGLSSSSEALKTAELAALRDSLPKGIVGDLAERARYAAPGIAISGTERVGEDIYDRIATPVGSGARNRVVNRYTDPKEIPGTIIDYGLRAGLPFAATGIAGLPMRPDKIARTNALLNTEGRLAEAAKIAERNAGLRQIDEADKLARSGNEVAGAKRTTDTERSKAFYGSDQYGDGVTKDLAAKQATELEQLLAALEMQRRGRQVPGPSGAGTAAQSPPGGNGAPVPPVAPVADLQPRGATGSSPGGPSSSPVSRLDDSTASALPNQPQNSGMITADPVNLSKLINMAIDRLEKAPLAPVAATANRALPPPTAAPGRGRWADDIQPTARDVLRSDADAGGSIASGNAARIGRAIDNALPDAAKRPSAADVRDRVSNLRDIVGDKPSRADLDKVFTAAPDSIYRGKKIPAIVAATGATGAASGLSSDAEASVIDEVMKQYMGGRGLDQITASDVQGKIEDQSAVDGVLGRLRGKVGGLSTKGEQLRAIRDARNGGLMESDTSPTGYRDPSGRFAAGGSP